MTVTGSGFPFSVSKRLGPATAMAQQIYDLFEKTPLFSDFNRQEMETLVLAMEMFGAAAGTTVIREGQLGDYMMLLVSGIVDVRRQDRWNISKLIGVAGPGKTLGEMSMIDAEPRFATCVVRDDILYAVLTREAFNRIIGEHPALGVKLLMKLVIMLSQRLRETSTKLLEFPLI